MFTPSTDRGRITVGYASGDPTSGGLRMNPIILGEQILLEVMVLEGLDMMIDCNRNRLIPYQGTWDQPVFRV